MVEELKMKYNYLLNRYYNGCNYICENPDTFDEYIKKIMEFKNELEKILEKIMNIQEVTQDEVLGGFKIC